VARSTQKACDTSTTSGLSATAVIPPTGHARITVARPTSKRGRPLVRVHEPMLRALDRQRGAEEDVQTRQEAIRRMMAAWFGLVPEPMPTPRSSTRLPGRSTRLSATVSPAVLEPRAKAC
jgi:hypothetical protein